MLNLVLTKTIIVGRLGYPSMSAHYPIITGTIFSQAMNQVMWKRIIRRRILTL